MDPLAFNDPDKCIKILNLDLDHCSTETSIAEPEP
jgi:hypothetical protein